MTAAAVPKDRSLAVQIQERGITNPQWHTLSKSLYPGALPESVLMVIDYCQARGLDPLKKPCHIVPMEVRDQRTGKYEWRDVVLPGVYELRTTAMRTGEYLGHAKPVYGDFIEYLDVSAPEWVDYVVYRWNEKAKAKCEFPVRVWFREVVGTKKNRQTGELECNARWKRSPIQMMTKCGEAAGLREGFPDELGGTMTEEEIEGRTIDVEPTPAPPPRPMTPTTTIEELDREPGSDDQPPPATDEPQKE